MRRRRDLPGDRCLAVITGTDWRPAALGKTVLIPPPRLQTPVLARLNQDSTAPGITESTQVTTARAGRRGPAIDQRNRKEVSHVHLHPHLASQLASERRREMLAQAQQRRARQPVALARASRQAGRAAGRMRRAVRRTQVDGTAEALICLRQ